MTRDEVFKDIEKTLGSVPGFFRIIPDGYLEHQWLLFKRNMFEVDRSTPISLKNRELMGSGFPESPDVLIAPIFTEQWPSAYMKQHARRWRMRPPSLHSAETGAHS